MSKSPITTHVLDTSSGCPATEVAVQLERQTASGEWEQTGRGLTDADGRITDLTGETLQSGIYRITFATKEHFAQRNQPCFYPNVSIEFEVVDTNQHYHVPLLINPFGYTTYRGS